MPNDSLEPTKHIIPIDWIDREERKKGRPIKPQYLDKEAGKSTYTNHPVDPEYYKNTLA